MKKLLFIALSFLAIQAFTQNNSIELAPGVNAEPNLFQKDTFNLFFSFPAIAFIGEYGVESDGTKLYSTQWLDDSLASYDLSGNVTERFVIPGVERVRDLAYDGQYYYGSPNEFYFYVLDLDNKTLINTVATTFKIRGMAYDPIEDVLWASEHWSPNFYKMDKQGNILDSWIPSGITMDAISGLAFDNNSPFGPFLWGFSQDSTGAMIVKYDIPNQAQTGNMIDVSVLALEQSYAGGLFLHEMDERAVPAIGGVIQNQLIFALELDYINMLVGIGDEHEVISLMKIYPNPARDVLNIKTDIKVPGIYSINIINQQGQTVQESTMNFSASDPVSVDISGLTHGVYFLQLTGNGLTITSTFLKAE